MISISFKKNYCATYRNLTPYTVQYFRFVLPKIQHKHSMWNEPNEMVARIPHLTIIIENTVMMLTLALQMQIQTDYRKKNRNGRESWI